MTITSALAGLTQVQATSTIGFTNALGTVTRTTGTANNVTAGCNPATQFCGNANKKWVDAWIEINPPTDTNAVNANHVLTITVHAVNGTLDAGPHTATASIVSGPGSFVGPPTCNYTGGARDGVLHGDDHLGGDGHLEGARDVEHLGRRAVDHPRDRDGGQHDALHGCGCESVQRRAEEVGRCVDRDQPADGHERGRTRTTC